MMRGLSVLALSGLLLAGGCGESEREREREERAEREDRRDRERRERREREVIERILREDAAAGAGTLANGGKDAAVTAQAMRRIDTNDAPSDFARAYDRHVAAWEDLARVDAQLRGTTERGQYERLVPERESVNQRIASTFQDVLRIARDRDADIPRESLPEQPSTTNSATNRLSL